MKIMWRSLSIVLVSAPIAFGYVAAQQPADKPAFEVASVRQNTEVGGRNHIYSDPHTADFRTVNAPLKMILQYAYQMPQTQIVGTPSWVDSTKFDIEAKSDSAISNALA